MMNWSKDKSILLTQAFLILFCAALLALDIFMFPVTQWYFGRIISGTKYQVTVTILYVCSMIGYVFLFCMWKLTSNIRKSEVFTDVNVRYLRIISWLCILVSLVCFAGGFFLRAFFLVSAAAAFMSLIVRVVKNAFQQAIAMKDELDLTI